MKHLIELVHRFIGFGKRCTACGKLASTTRATLRHGKSEELIQQYLICDKCSIEGIVIRFEFDDGEGKETGKKERRQRVKISRKLETELALDIGGKVQPGSGNKDEKGDVRVMDEWRVEHKYTDSVSGFRLSVIDLNTIIKHANVAGEMPALVVNFRRLGKRKFVIVPYEVFIQLKELARESNKYR